MRETLNLLPCADSSTNTKKRLRQFCWIKKYNRLDLIRIEYNPRLFPNCVLGPNAANTATNSVQGGSKTVSIEKGDRRNYKYLTKTWLVLNYIGAQQAYLIPHKVLLNWFNKRSYLNISYEDITDTDEIFLKKRL